MASALFAFDPSPSPAVPDFVVKPIQAKLNRLVQNRLLIPCTPVLENGRLDGLTVAVMEFFRDTFAIDAGALFLPGVCGCVGPSTRHRPARKDVPSRLLPQPTRGGFGGLATPASPSHKPQAAYDPLPDLEPGSAFLQVMQWAVDHSEGPISQMTKEALVELAKLMVPDAKPEVVERSTPSLVKALLEGRTLYNHDLDSTGWLKMALATISVETSGFVPNDEGVDYNSKDNNSAYEDFDIYEPYYKYAPSEADANKLIQDSRDRRVKKMGSAFKEPTRKPHKGSRAVADNKDKGDGALYKGRGLVQLTHRGSYDKAGKALGLDLLGHPEQLADKDAIELNCRALVWFLNSEAGPFGLRTYDSVKAAISANNTLIMRQAVNGASASPAGLDRFVENFGSGTRFLQQAMSFKYQRIGLRPR